MNEITLARALHVLGVVLWIGGVAFVTTVLLPAVRWLKAAEERVDFFELIERQFAIQARVSTTLVGVTGFYMIEKWDLWSRFAEPSYWWMNAMFAVWLLFSVMLFIAEPLFLHKWLLAQAKLQPERTFMRIERMHRILLTLSLLTVAGAVMGSHGWQFF